MAINKVEYGDETLIDLTEDTVTEEDVAEGITFHAPDGEQKVGRMSSGGNGIKTVSYAEWQAMSEEERSKGAYYVPDYPIDTTIIELSQRVDEVQTEVGNINVYVGEDKKLHFVDKDGADSVLPFSGGAEVSAFEIWYIEYYNSTYIARRFYNNASSYYTTAGTWTGVHTSQTVAKGSNITVTALADCLLLLVATSGRQIVSLKKGQTYIINRQAYTTRQYGAYATIVFG